MTRQGKDRQMTSEDSVVLEHLAATGWFVEHGEVALTAGLTFCLEKDASAAHAFINLVRERANNSEQDLPTPDRWHAESIDDERGRVDITGWLDAEEASAPVVLVEAKVS